MKALFLVGPTGVGKSSLALQIAEKYRAPIVNIDSVQMYQRLNIGSAKPTPEEFQKVPHHLFDIVSPGKELSAGDFRRVAIEKLNELSNHESLVVIVGGSGFYYRALTRGMFDVPPMTEKQKALVAEKYDRLSDEDLLTTLQAIDPPSALRLNPADRYRVMRAIEVFEIHNKTLSDLSAEFVPTPLPYEQVHVGLMMDRKKLIARIEQRTQLMLHNGLIEETRALMNEGHSDWRALGSVGYREVKAYLKGTLPKEQLAKEINQSTRQLAKRQMTWFRKEPDLHWINVDSGASKAFNLIEGLIKQ